MTDIECVRSQNDEFKALTCIYLDEFHVVKETAPHKFNILCKPYIGNQFQYQINIMFEFSQNYPKGPLKYEIEPITGITRDNLIAITNKIQDIIYDNRNRPIVYDIVEETRSWIHEYLVEGKFYQSEQVIKEKVEEIFERPKFAAFTPVTEESFKLWKKEFDEKNKINKILKKEKEPEEKVTGKEWFLGKKQQIQEESQQQDEDEEFEEEEVEEEEKVEVAREQDLTLFQV